MNKHMLLNKKNLPIYFFADIDKIVPVYFFLNKYKISYIYDFI